MRVVLLLLVLAVFGVTLAQWLGNKPSNPAPRETSRSSSDRVAPPAVPTRPQEMKRFEKDMNQFMQDAASERARQMESQEK